MKFFAQRSVMSGGMLNPGMAKLRNVGRRIFGGELESTSAALEGNQSSVGLGDVNWRPRFAGIGDLGDQAYLAAYQGVGQETMATQQQQTNVLLQEIRDKLGQQVLDQQTGRALNNNTGT